MNISGETDVSTSLPKYINGTPITFTTGMKNKLDKGITLVVGKNLDTFIKKIEDTYIITPRYQPKNMQNNRVKM